MPLATYTKHISKASSQGKHQIKSSKRENQAQAKHPMKAKQHHFRGNAKNIPNIWVFARAGHPHQTRQTWPRLPKVVRVFAIFSQTRNTLHTTYNFLNCFSGKTSVLEVWINLNPTLKKSRRLVVSSIYSRLCL